MKVKLDTLFDWLDRLEQLHPSEIELGLQRVAQVTLNLALGPLPKLITVAGTNGKGSCIAAMESVLLESGYRVGAYTSPHLLHFSERIRLQGIGASDEVLIKAFERVDSARGDIPLTYFEFSTLAAFVLFQESQLDVWLLEVGLGGRLDAVNVLNPDVSVITSIALDHQDWLGEDRESIGAEKAGIFRAETPAICGDLAAPLSTKLRACEVGASWYGIGHDFGFQEQGSSWDWFGLNAQGERVHLSDLPRSSLKLSNLACALQALFSARIKLTSDQVKGGLAKAYVPGRYQSEVIKGHRVVFDVAHNPAAAKVLAENLRADPCVGKTHAVFSVLKDKDVSGIVQSVSDQIDSFVLAGLPGVARAMPVEQLKTVVEQAGITSDQQCSSVPEALDELIGQCGENDRIIVFGSFYSVAHALEWTGVQRLYGDQN